MVVVNSLTVEVAGEGARIYFVAHEFANDERGEFDGAVKNRRS